MSEAEEDRALTEFKSEGGEDRAVTGYKSEGGDDRADSDDELNIGAVEHRTPTGGEYKSDATFFGAQQDDSFRPLIMDVSDSFYENIGLD